MSQLIFKDSGLLIHEGQPPIIYQQWKSYNSEIHEIVSINQEFPNRRRENQIWFYFPTLQKFFLNERAEHAIVKAFKEILGSRFNEIMDDLEETGPVQDCLHELNIKKLRGKLDRLRQKGLITIQERTVLDDTVVHIGDNQQIG
jgi:hypothetical protein